MLTRLLLTTALLATYPLQATFEVASIKRNAEGRIDLR